MASVYDDYTEMLRKKHRDYPIEFFGELLEAIWMNRDEEQSIREWKRLCTQVHWYAEDAMQCLDYVLAHPPANLIELMQERGWIMLDHGAGPDTLVKTYHEKYLARLVDMTAQCKHIYGTQPETGEHTG